MYILSFVYLDIWTFKRVKEQPEKSRISNGRDSWKYESKRIFFP